jgi:hypothetical protein
MNAWDYGILAAVLAGIGTGLALIIRWIGKHVVKPVIDRHCRLVETLTKAVRSMSKSYRKLADEKHAERARDVLPAILLALIFASPAAAQQWQPVQPECPPGKG